MKTTIKTVRILLTVAAMAAMAHVASAAVRQVTSVTPSPNSASVSLGVATNVTCNVAVVSGSGASTRYLGIATNMLFVSPAEATITTSISPAWFVFPNANSTSNATLSVTTTAGTPSGTYTVGIIVGTNPPNAALVTQVTNFFTLNVGAVFVPQKLWSPAGVNSNWSTAGNWTAPGAPTPSNDLYFVDLGAVGTAGQVDNIVDANSTVGSLTFGQTNNFHTTLIAAGATLNVLGAIGLNVGTGTDPGDGQLTTAAITGSGGALVVSNSSANVAVGQAHSTINNGISQSQATLDMSGLNSFTATASRLLVGVDTVIKGSSGVLNLARTNKITLTGATAPQFDVGDNSQSQGTPTVASVLLLGQTNTIFADSVAVGRGKTDANGGLMQFNSSFASPTAVFRGSSGGSSRVGTWSIGDGATARTYWTYGTNDFSLGTVDARVDTMYIGKGAVASSPNPGTGVLVFCAGTIDVNTLAVGYSQDGVGTGSVNANGGSLVVNTSLELAHGATAVGSLNISSATVTANNGVINGGGTATISLNNATLNSTNSTATIGTSGAPINNFSIANSSLKVAIQSLLPSVAVANLTVGGVANTIDVSAVPLLTGFPTQFPVIKYGLNGGINSGDLTTFVLGALPSASPAYGGYISNNVANNSIDLVLTNGPFIPSLTWDGTPTGNWNTSTANWRPQTGPNTAYTQGSFVTFNDILTGTANVNLTTALTPASLTVSNNATNYVFSGAGSLSGSMALVKSGAASLTLAETGGDNFSGGVTVNGGTLVLDNANNNSSGGTTINGGMVQVGNNDSSGSLPAGAVANAGTLSFNRTDNITVTNNISGAGTLLQRNVNVTTLSGNSTFAGSVVISQGTLQVGSTNGIGLATSVTVSNAATFDVGGQSLFGNGNANLVVTVSGAGVGGAGAIVNNSAISPARVLHLVTLTGDTTFGGAADWDIRNSTGSSAPADAELNGAFNLTKVGTNTVTFRGVTIDAGLGDINLQAGGLTFTATATAPISSLGNSSGTITVLTNATLTLDIGGSIPAKNIVLTNGGTLRSTATNTISSPVTLAAAANNTITANTGSQLTITTAIDGPGGFSKNGSSTLILNAANTYGGSTVVSGGTLTLFGGGFDGSISASTNINITPGATLDVSGRGDGTLTLASGQALVGGTGTNLPATVKGILVASVGATVAPGTSTTNFGILTVSSNATLQGTTAMKLDATAGTNDQLVAYGIAYGGTLTVTNISATPANGQSFKLFTSASGYTNSFGSVILPVAAGLTWSNTLASDGRITAIVAGGAPPAQPRITSIAMAGANLIISGTNGTASQQFVLMTSTNITLALPLWSPVVTNTFTGGPFSITNAVNPFAPQNYYILRLPY